MTEAVTDFDEGAYASQGGGSGVYCIAAGWLLLFIGCGLAYLAFNIDTTVPTEPVVSPGGYDSPNKIGGDSVHNLGLLQQQMMWLHVGLALVLAGFLGIFAGAIIKAIRPGS